MTTRATRDKILQAALEVFAQKGYHSALVDDIVRVARTSKGGVYHHFPNKEALFLALVDEFAGRLPESVAAPLGAAEGSRRMRAPRSAAGPAPCGRHLGRAEIRLL